MERMKSTNEMPINELPSGVSFLDVYKKAVLTQGFVGGKYCVFFPDGAPPVKLEIDWLKARCFDELLTFCTK